MGKNKSNLLNLSIKSTYMKGNRINPIDVEASIAAQEIITDNI